MSPIPYLVTEALLSNTGGVATLVGDPPNVLIGSAAGLSFTDFLVYSLPIVLVAWAGALLLLQYLFRKELSIRPRSAQAVMELSPRESLNQPQTARRILVVLIIVILFFFLHHALYIAPSFVALGAAAVALLWVQPDINEVLKNVEWSVLIFFAALFVMVGGLEGAGVLESIVSVFRGASSVQPMMFGILLIWIIAALSVVVDNVPITIALIPVIRGLGDMDMDVAPLWWAHAFGAGFGGNGTIIGSTATSLLLHSLRRRAHRLHQNYGYDVVCLSCC